MSLGHQDFVCRQACHSKVLRRYRAFTLIELIVALVIIGILAAIAFPSYQNSIRKSRRSDGQAALLGFANAMERHFTANTTYLGAAAGGADSGAPAIFPTQAPIDGSTKYYNLTIKNTITARTYTLVATPINAQAGDGVMELDNTGVRRWDEDNDGAFSATEKDWEPN
jgi:type IV pilus assembly protein PilE